MCDVCMKYIINKTFEIWARKVTSYESFIMAKTQSGVTDRLKLSNFIKKLGKDINSYVTRNVFNLWNVVQIHYIQSIEIKVKWVVPLSVR